MIKDLLRSVGIGCLIAGGTLYAINNMPQAEEKSLKKELADTKKELKVVKKELAISQTITLDEAPAEEIKPETDAAAEQSPEPESEDVETTVIKKKISVKPGSNSSEISSTLERAHIIEDAAKFDIYMKDYGYAGKIQIGAFDLNSDMSFKEIAEILTK